MIIIRTTLGVAAVKDRELHEMNVGNVFLHNDLNDDVYVKLPKILGVSTRRTSV